MNSWMDGWAGGLLNGWTDGRMNGQMDGWMLKLTSIFPISCKNNHLIGKNFANHNNLRDGRNRAFKIKLSIILSHHLTVFVMNKWFRYTGNVKLVHSIMQAQKYLKRFSWHQTWANQKSQDASTPVHLFATSKSKQNLYYWLIRHIIKQKNTQSHSILDQLIHINNLFKAKFIYLYFLLF